MAQHTSDCGQVGLGAGVVPMTRRAVLAGASAAAGLAASAALAGAGMGGAALASETDAAGSGPAVVPGGARVVGDADELAWDKEADFVVVGSGTGCYGALGATEAGCSAIVLEKAGVVGGTTRLSGCCVWVPGNRHQEEEGFGADLPDERVLAYLGAIDCFGSGSPELRRDYVENARTFFAWAEEAWGFKQAVYTVLGDYQDNPGCKAMGRSLIHVDDDGQALTTLDYYEKKVVPKLEERGVETLTETPATNLVLDGAGAVAGVVAQGPDGSELLVRARKGVLLAAGGFDRNPAMRAKYLRGPVFGSNSVAGCTGDGILLGRRAGADLANMASVWQLPFYVTDPANDGAGDLDLQTDWFEYAGLPGAIVVNGAGRRFCSENTAYGAADLAFYDYSTTTFGFENLPAYLVCDAEHVGYYGWPAYSAEQPEWFKEYASLEELAEDCGIDAAGLAEEVARFNQMAEAGVDEDFHRGEGNYGPINVAGYGVDRPELANPCMAPVATPPFYAAQVAPGVCGGTCGGLVVDADARVLDLDGEPIRGLYACGNTSASPFGSAYPGAGGTDGAGFYRAFRAANHACGLGMF